jgi:hypothetical protein
MSLQQVQDFLDAAAAACSKPPADQPFLCVDLTFIAGMLHHGYRLAADAKLGTVSYHLSRQAEVT